MGFNLSKPMKSQILSLIIPIIALSLNFSSEAQTPYTLLVYGDSLSAAYGISEEAGWVSQLEIKLIDENWPYRVVNGSISGETTTGGLERLPAMLGNYTPDLVILELGGNDGLRGLPLDLIKANLKKMVSMIQSMGSNVLLAGIQIPPNYGPRYTEPFFATFNEIAEEESLPLIPFLIDGIPQNPELMQLDGIHPKAEAQHIILENVWVVLEPILRSN